MFEKTPNCRKRQRGKLRLITAVRFPERSALTFRQGRGALIPGDARQTGRQLPWRLIYDFTGY